MKRKYLNAVRCVACHGSLSFDEQLFSNGRCPLCGHKGKNACTVVETYDVCILRTELRPWWAFWLGPRYRYEKAEPALLHHGHSEEWWNGVHAFAAAVNATADDYLEDEEGSLKRLCGLLAAVGRDQHPDTWSEFKAPSEDDDDEDEDEDEDET